MITQVLLFQLSSVEINLANLFCLLQMSHDCTNYYKCQDSRLQLHWRWNVN